MWLKLTAQVNNVKFLINMNKVRYVTDCGAAIILVLDDDEIGVKETLEEIEKMIEVETELAECGHK